ncbi:MAG: hypothetical protein ACFCGT_20335 [Sandaracinaceae bacterium]
MVPVLVDLATGGRRVFAYLAADAFYYLTVARNVAALGRVTFDQEHATNGFHPLWQAMTAGLVALVRPLGATDVGVLWVVVAVCLALVAAALLGLAMAMAADGELPAAFALVPVGAVGLALAPLWVASLGQLATMNPYEGSPPLWGTLWFAVNGMETPVLLAAYAGLAALYVRGDVLGSDRHAALFGVAMAAVVLARLDHAVFPAVLGVTLFGRALAARDVDAVRRLALAGAVGAAPVALYLAWNELTFGHLVPVSGRLKTSFPRPEEANARMLASLALSPAPVDWLERTARAAAVLVPMALARVELSVGPRPRLATLRQLPSARLDHLLRTGAVGCLLLGGYNALFVRWSHQGHWYLPVSAVLASLWLVRWAARARRGRSPAVPRPLVHGGAAVLALLAFAFLHRHPDTHTRYATFVLDLVPRIHAHYGEERPRLVEFDDGVVAYGTGYPTMPATALTLDEEAIEAARADRLLDLALERGFRRFTSSVIDRRRVYGGIARFRGRHAIRLELSAEELGFGIWLVTPRGTTADSGSRSGGGGGP